MDIFIPLATIALAGLIHASFQLSVSTLTLLSSHVLGTNAGRKQLSRLVSGFSLGTILMTLLLLLATVQILRMSFDNSVPSIAWATVCGFLAGLSVAVWIFYYRRGPGTSLWLPRGLARYLVNRSKATKSVAEAFSLGTASVVAEILFIAGPLLVSGLLLFDLAPMWQLAGIGIYAVFSLLPFICVSILISNGFSISKIQRWRSSNKGFLQFIAGCGLIILAICIYANHMGDGAAFIERGYYQ